ncbi:hypothetical protein ACWKSP_22220 [Micromonosporaceae bacterium Da 78-11]
MPRTKWRTVSCTDDGLRSHSSQPAAYTWVGKQPVGVRFRVQYDEQQGGGWRSYSTVWSAGDGMTDEG